LPQFALSLASDFDPLSGEPDVFSIGPRIVFRTNFFDGFNDSTFTLRFGSTFEIWTE
jgi:hypothetical protein